MTGSVRANEKDKPPSASANPLIQANYDYANTIAPNINVARGVTFQEGNVSGGRFVTDPDMTLPIAPGWENMYSMNQSITQGISETSGNPMDYFMNASSFQNPQINLSSNTANTDLPEVPLLPELSMEWSPQFINQGHNAISAGGMNDGAYISNLEIPWFNKNPTIARNFAGDLQMSRQGGESTFVPFNRPQVNGNIVGSPVHYRSRDTIPVHSRSNVNFHTSQRGVQGKVEGSFLSLGIGGTEEVIHNSQLGSREISEKLREAASAELKMARACKAMGQTLDANLTGSERNTSGFSNQLGHVDRMSQINNEIGVHRTPNGGPGSSSYHMLQMQQNDMQHGISRHSNSNFPTSRNIRYGDLDHYRAFVGDQAMQSGMLGGSSAQVFDSIQYDLNRLAPEAAKPSWTASHTPSGQLRNNHFKNGNSLPSGCSTNSPSVGLGRCSTRQNYAVKQGQQLLSQNGMPTEGLGGSLFPQRIVVPQVAWVSSGQATTDAPFPKRLGVEYNMRDKPQAAEINLGTSFQTNSTGQICQHLDKGSTCLPDHLLRSSNGQSQNALIQLPKDLRRAASTNGRIMMHGVTIEELVMHRFSPRCITLARDASFLFRNGYKVVPDSLVHHALAVGGPSKKPDFYVRPNHKRTAVANPPASNWVQRQKITHPTIHHSMPIPLPTKPPIPVTTALVHPSIPCTSNFRPRIPVASSPIASHITWKDPDATPQLIGYKCLLCKRDLSLTSEGAVYQPTVPPAVAVLPCGHTFHDQCLHNITPQDQSKDPPCIPCAIGEI